MNDRPKSPSGIFQDALNRATAEKSLDKRLEEREGENSSLPGFLIKNVIDVTKRPK
jgi:hypothetical protein